ncbi:hypothetical protein [Sphaerospermopsis sp. LEGE 08334]|uniref:hypothetical protein n=1 Tax=Sphaerospermopsis sp. LEGE 08334 TaxID=1828651 RepID=UPI001880B5DA|nr:hypothetical protein [Sphaerospermopsis sp. LEGE 08334]MBE9059304.1 hypothetical protein [Sphaerospermopsis sp. LEGE 08334]
MEEFRPEEYINPKDFMVDLLPTWKSLITNDSEPLGVQLQQVIGNFVWYSNPDLYQIVCSYMMLSQKWCKVVPIMFCYGLPGSGKSTISILTAYLHNQEYTFSSSDTFPSIRNSLDHLRWIDEDKQYEKDGAILCWDNLGSHDLRRDPRLLQLLLFGYNRSTDKVMIANNDGTNKVFHVFCPKVISSVEPLHQDVDFQELHRRFLIINHKKVDGLNINLESINDYDFSDFAEFYFDFWHNKLNCIQYVSRRKQFSSNKQWKITETQKTVSIDLAAIHSLIYETTTLETITLIEKYWQQIMNTNVKSEIEDALETFMKVEFMKLENIGGTYVRHSVIKDYIALLIKDGVITNSESKEFKKVLRKLGYISTKIGWFKNESV